MALECTGLSLECSRIELGCIGMHWDTSEHTSSSGMH